jgi:hypothetical protein
MQEMLGWLILFALMTIFGIILTLASPASASAMVVFTFGLLFLLGLLTRLARGRAW